jgi:hypothetical protein
MLHVLAEPEDGIVEPAALDALEAIVEPSLQRQATPGSDGAVVGARLATTAAASRL